VVSKFAARISGVLAGVAFCIVASCFLFAQTAPGPDASEVTSKETQPSFRLQTERNLVTVRVTVRDSKGQPVGNLQKEDFNLFDQGKLQTVTHFTVESMAPPKASPEKAPAQPAFDPERLSEAYIAPNAAQRYLALFFDDAHLAFEDLVQTRDAAERYLKTSMLPGDRVGIFTASGHFVLDFTNDLAKIHETLFLLRPLPNLEQREGACPDVSDYQAYLILHERRPDALDIAMEEVYVCHNADGVDQTIPRNPTVERAEAEGEALRVENRTNEEANYSLRGLAQLVRRLALLPGQRHVIFISPGFITQSLHEQMGEVTDRALRANVIINALDARGLYVPQPLGDISQRPIALPGRTDLMGVKSALRLERAQVATAALSDMATDTGGHIFINSNDFDRGFREMGAMPEVSYTLAFSPQNLKSDGAFHTIKLTVPKTRGLTLQARRGYYALRRPEDSSARANEEIEQAIFSKDEINELPLTVQTQFFKVNELDAQLSVLTHVDVRLLHFRKDGERNLDNLTLVTALFDRDGKMVKGTQKTLEFRVRDQTMDQLLRSGVTVKTNFDIKAGTYLVRQVVRDTEGGQLAGLNRTVEIPY
jgi:VWFA-related protein